MSSCKTGRSWRDSQPILIHSSFPSLLSLAHLRTIIQSSAPSSLFLLSLTWFSSFFMSSCKIGRIWKDFHPFLIQSFFPSLLSLALSIYPFLSTQFLILTFHKFKYDLIFPKGRRPKYPHNFLKRNRVLNLCIEYILKIIIPTLRSMV